LSIDSLSTGEEQMQMDSLVNMLAFDPAETHCILVQYQTDLINVNRLQFDVALYNFTTFLIRDYELSIAKVGQMDVLLIQGFENAQDAMRYRSWINFQNEVPESKYPGIRFIIVSDSNLKLLQEGVDPELYLEFFKKNYSGIKPNP
jgi:hypothetical protein